MIINLEHDILVVLTDTKEKVKVRSIKERDGSDLGAQTPALDP